MRVSLWLRPLHLSMLYSFYWKENQPQEKVLGYNTSKTNHLFQAGSTSLLSPHHRQSLTASPLPRPVLSVEPWNNTELWRTQIEMDRQWGSHKRSRAFSLKVHINPLTAFLLPDHYHPASCEETFTLCYTAITLEAEPYLGIKTAWQVCFYKDMHLTPLQKLQGYVSYLRTVMG